MNIHILPLHSVANIITNSSSELFVCGTEKTKEQIQEMLDLLAQVVGHHGVGEIKTYEGVSGLKEVMKELGLDYLAECEYSRSSGFDQLMRNFIPSSAEIKLPKIYYNYNYNKDPEEDWHVHREREKSKKEEIMQNIFDWLDANEEILSKYIKTITTLYSEDDNSIPYELFDLLDRQLNATHFHLG